MRWGRKRGSNSGCYYFLHKKKIVKRFVQCHVFARSPPNRHPNDKYPVNTSQRFRFVSKCFTAVLFGSNGYSYTYSMVQSPSWEANWFAASQEIPRISRNPKVHYQTHKRPPPVSILGPPYPVHIPTSHLLEIHHNIIHPSTPRPPQWSYTDSKQSDMGVYNHKVRHPRCFQYTNRVECMFGREDEGV